MSLQSLTDTVAHVLKSDPPWLFYPHSYLYSSLCMLGRNTLRMIASRVSPDFVNTKYYNKLSCINLILDDFNSHCAFLSSHGTSVIHTYLQQLNVNVSDEMARTIMISTFFEAVYRFSVAAALHKSPLAMMDSFPIHEQVVSDDMPWLMSDLSPWMTRVPCKLSIGRLKECLQLMHPST